MKKIRVLRVAGAKTCTLPTLNFTLDQAVGQIAFALKSRHSSYPLISLPCGLTDHIPLDMLFTLPIQAVVATS
jgi:hypothetical protein